jgi:medium-chain acyl-[acyl-carrier-protein] hydrolase
MTPTSLSADRWIVQTKPAPFALLRLFCFPFAGGGAQSFRAWPEKLPSTIEVCAVQLPGHETRMREKPLSSIAPMIEAMTPSVIPYLDKPFVFFGHSMGAIIAFELARALRRHGKLLPKSLMVSARVAPHLPIPRRPIHDLPQPDFIEGLKSLNGTPKQVLEDSDLMELVIPLLRADLAVHETYVYLEEEPLQCDIMAFGGLQDPEAGREAIDAWRIHTSGEFVRRMVPGDHFFIEAAQSLFLNMLSRELYRIAGNGGPRSAVADRKKPQKATA